MKLQVIDFVECDYCEEDGFINNHIYKQNKKNLDNIKCWNCENVYIVDKEYMHKLFNQEVC